jgi:hypothetical protein
MIDDAERATMAAPIEGQERALELTGPSWRAPGLKAVLSQLPFLRGQPYNVSGGARGAGRAASHGGARLCFACRPFWRGAAPLPP